MDKNIHYVKVKREKTGVCNICGKTSVLSWDHVPPKGSIYFNDVEIYSIANNFLTIDNPSKVLSQNGMKFRTICSECNSRIGSKYDVVFNDFIKQATTVLNESYRAVASVDFVVDIKLLVMSILAHLLAAKGDVENTVPDELMRKMLAEEEFSHESPLNIHYWFYPFASNQVVRDLAIAKILTGKNAMVSILKIYPIAFLITQEDMYVGEIPRLNDYIGLASIKFNLTFIPEVRWPIIVDDETIVMGGQSISSSVIAVPRTIK